LRPQTQYAQHPPALHGTVKGTSAGQRVATCQDISHSVTDTHCNAQHYSSTPSAAAETDEPHQLCIYAQRLQHNNCGRPGSRGCATMTRFTHLERTLAASLHRPTHHPSHSRCCSSGRQNPAHCY
jgi:hypothetical protein